MKKDTDGSGKKQKVKIEADQFKPTVKLPALPGESVPVKDSMDMLAKIRARRDQILA